MFNEDKVSPCYRMRLKRSHVLSANNRNTERLSGETAFVHLDKKKVRELPSDFHNAQTQTRWHERTDDESRACVTECLLSRYALTMTLMEWPAARKGRKRGVTQRRLGGICLPPSYATYHRTSHTRFQKMLATQEICPHVLPESGDSYFCCWLRDSEHLQRGSRTSSWIK